MSAVSKAIKSTSWMALLLSMLVLAGCATTPKIDWNSRIGAYSYDQAVIDFGPPDKQAKLDNGVTVAEWMTRRGYTYASPFPSYSYYHWYYGPWVMGPYFVDTYTAPDAFLRLVFNPEGRLASYKKFYR